MQVWVKVAVVTHDQLHYGRLCSGLGAFACLTWLGCPFKDK